MRESKIVWYKYPEEKPKRVDEYLVTVECGYFKTTSTSIWKNNKFKHYVNETGRIGSIVAWAEMPEPYNEEV